MTVNRYLFLTAILISAFMPVFSQVPMPSVTPLPVLIKVAAPEPFESQFQKELSDAASAQNPSAARLAAWKNFYQGMTQRSGLPKKEILTHIANKILEVADVDQYQAYDIIVWELGAADLSTVVETMQKTAYGKAFIKARMETHRRMTARYQETGLKQKLSDFLVPGVGLGQTKTSNLPYKAPDLSNSKAALDNLAIGKRLYEEGMARGGGGGAFSLSMFAHLKDAAKLGNVEAMRLLVAIYKRRDSAAEALPWHLKLADLGDKDSVVFAAEHFESISLGERVSRIEDLRKSETYYAKAVAAGRSDLFGKLTDIRTLIRWQFASPEDARAIAKMPFADQLFFDHIMRSIRDTLKTRPYSNVRISMTGSTQLQSLTHSGGYYDPLDPRFFAVFHTNKSLGYITTLSMSTMVEKIVSGAGTRFETRQPFESRIFTCTLPTAYTNNAYSVSSCEIDYEKAKHNHGLFKFRAHKIGAPNAPLLPWGLPPGGRAALVLYYDLRSLKS